MMLPKSWDDTAFLDQEPFRTYFLARYEAQGSRGGQGKRLDILVSEVARQVLKDEGCVSLPAAVIHSATDAT